MSEEDFYLHYPVTEQQRALLRHYVALLRQWNTRVNLIGQSTTDDIWKRHILDSAALVPHIPRSDLHIADLGSGAGFPGIVLAILNKNPITLIESVGKKSAFLQEVKNQLKLSYAVINSRIELYSPEQKFDLITARAVADLNKLWHWSSNLRTQNCIGLFLKGKRFEQEFPDLTQAYPTIECSTIPYRHGIGSIIRLRQADHDA